MKVYSAAEVAQKLSYDALISALRAAFAKGNVEVPLRSMYKVGLPSGSQATFGLMPAWSAGEVFITKLLTIMPDNPSQGLPTIHAQIILFDGATGEPKAIVDGAEITRRRTAAASALAATYLARTDASRLLVVGTGPQAVHQALAHVAARPIRSIGIWGRTRDKAQAVVEEVKRGARTLSVQVVDDLETAVREADIVSCVTSSSEPVVFGGWLKPGAFLDLVGSHTPNARECDDEAARRSRIYVDTFSGALAEAGDILIPLRNGTIAQSDVLGDLSALCAGKVQGRTAPDEITLFKSVGTAIEDLVAAQLVATTR